MTRTTYTFNVSYPIPHKLSTSSVIAALHRHENLLTLQPLVTSYDEIPSPNVSELDPYFDTPGSPVKAYVVTERIVIVPGIGELGKYSTTIVTNFQNITNGLKTSAVASAGVVVRATYIVQQSGRNISRSGNDDMETIGYRGVSLSEKVTAECSSWLMPFVKHSMEGAHKDLCRNLLERTASQLANKGYISKEDQYSRA
jgi:hypothetical protein